MKKVGRDVKGLLIGLFVGAALVGAIAGTISIPLFSSASNAGKTKTCEAGLETINVAIAGYTRDAGASPEALDDLVPRHLAAVPDCPWGGNTECYELTGSGLETRGACVHDRCGASDEGGAALCEH
ncbi:MAG: hypothetical protein ACE5E0_05280 [Terriglobia bacterium]